jgi:hypothetical protein
MYLHTIRKSLEYWLRSAILTLEVYIFSWVKEKHEVYVYWMPTESHGNRCLYCNVVTFNVITVKENQLLFTFIVTAMRLEYYVRT